MNWQTALEFAAAGAGLVSMLGVWLLDPERTHRRNVRHYIACAQRVVRAERALLRSCRLTRADVARGRVEPSARVLRGFVKAYTVGGDCK